MSASNTPKPTSRFLPRICRAFRERPLAVSPRQFLSEVPDCEVFNVPDMIAPPPKSASVNAATYQAESFMGTKPISPINWKQPIHYPTKSPPPYSSRKEMETAGSESNSPHVSPCSPSSSSSSLSSSHVSRSPWTPPALQRPRHHYCHATTTSNTTITASDLTDGVYVDDPAIFDVAVGSQWSSHNTLGLVNHRQLRHQQPKLQTLTPPLVIPRLVVSSFEENIPTHRAGPPASILNALEDLRAFHDEGILDIFIDNWEGDEARSLADSSMACAYVGDEQEVNLYPSIPESAIGIAI